VREREDLFHHHLDTALLTFSSTDKNPGDEAANEKFQAVRQPLGGATQRQ